MNVPARCIEFHRQPGPAGYSYTVVTSIGAGQSVQCASLPVSVDVTALFAGLAG